MLHSSFTISFGHSATKGVSTLYLLALRHQDSSAQDWPVLRSLSPPIFAFFPTAEISFAPTIERQKIVDSWPEDCDDSAARRDWGWKPEHGFHDAFAKYLVPKIKARYGC